MSSSVLVQPSPAVSGLRKEWTFATLGGFAILAAVGLASPRSLAGSLPVWGYCSWLLFRGLSENVREGEGMLLPSLGVPTLITLVRGFLVALSAGFLLSPAVAAPAYSLAAALDHADGRLARRRKRETRLGSWLDMEVDAVGILVATVAGIALGKLPLWYLNVGLARYLFVLGLWWRRRAGRPVRDLDRLGLRRILAGCQMGFLAVALWPPVSAELTLFASHLFGGASLAMFLRDWLYVSRRMPESEKQRKLFSLSLALWSAAAVILFFSLRQVSLSEAFRAVGRLDGTAIAVLVLVNLAAVLLFAVRWWSILKGLGRPLPLLRAASYRLAAFGVSYFTPGPQVGGEPLQVLLLERRHAAPREDAIASVALDRLVEAVVNFSYLAGAFLLLVRPGPLWITVPFVLVPLGYLVALGLDRRPLTRVLDLSLGDRRAGGFRAVLRASEARAGLFCRERPMFLALAVLASISSFGLMLAEYWLMARFLGIELSFRGVILGLTAARIAYLLFFPAALGVFEAGQIAALGVLGFPPSLGVSLALVVRARDVLLAATGLSWGLKAASSPQ